MFATTVEIERMSYYDRSDWHTGGQYPKDLPLENGSPHIGIFLAWAIQMGLIGEFHLENSHESVKAVKERRMTGVQFFESECDAKFSDEDLNDEGNKFAKAYYGRFYFRDYTKTLASGLPSVYHVKDDWINYDKMSAMITDRYNAWKIGRLKPWWKFWL